MGKDNDDKKGTKNDELMWTRVSNAHTLEIYVRVTININELLSKKVSDLVKNPGQRSIFSANEENDSVLDEQFQHYHQHPGFVKISPGEYLDFFIAGPDGKVFITVRTEAEETADNFPIQNNGGIVVDKKGCIQLLKAGSAWIDQRDRNHEPSIDAK